jgi:hypothetical protein
VSALRMDVTCSLVKQGKVGGVVSEGMTVGGPG